MLSALGIADQPGVFLVGAANFEGQHVPMFPPEIPALIAGFDVPDQAIKVKLVLSCVYPQDHPVRFVDKNGNVTDGLLGGMGDDGAASLSGILVPALEKGTSFEQFQEIVAHLRAPDGCPWDREQTHLSLRKHLLEETYETLSALDSQNPQKMSEEFGDLLLQIVLHAQIASEFEEFRMTDIIKNIHDKIIRRHPHVFGDVEVDGVGNVLSNWEKIKAAERKSGGEAEKGVLDGLPPALPALSQAQEYQDRAARVGFDWPEIGGVLDKINEEINEVRQSTSEAELAAELGDLFFALVNLARWKKIDAESALRETNIKFKKRFSFIEDNARKQGKHIQELSLDEMETFWQAAKKVE
jgi:tetrapyrrole methylase family protein/MazG family protein